MKATDLKLNLLLLYAFFTFPFILISIPYTYYILGSAADILLLILLLNTFFLYFFFKVLPKFTLLDTDALKIKKILNITLFFFPIMLGFAAVNIYRAF